MAKDKLYKSYKWMYLRYVKDNMTEQEIAREADADQATINRWLHKHGLKRS